MPDIDFVELSNSPPKAVVGGSRQIHPKIDPKSQKGAPSFQDILTAKKPAGRSARLPVAVVETGARQKPDVSHSPIQEADSARQEEQPGAVEIPGPSSKSPADTTAAPLQNSQAENSTRADSASETKQPAQPTVTSPSEDVALEADPQDMVEILVSQGSGEIKTGSQPVLLTGAPDQPVVETSGQGLVPQTEAATGSSTLPIGDVHTLETIAPQPAASQGETRLPLESLAQPPSGAADETLSTVKLPAGEGETLAPITPAPNGNEGILLGKPSPKAGDSTLDTGRTRQMTEKSTENQPAPVSAPEPKTAASQGQGQIAGQSDHPEREANQPAATPQVAPQVPSQAPTAKTAISNPGSGPAELSPDQVSPAKTQEKQPEGGQPGVYTAGKDAPAALAQAESSQVREAPVSAPSLPQGEPAHPASVQLLQQITPGIKSMVRDGLESMRLQLNPAELGKIDLHLVSRSGEIHIAMVAESASTGALLEHNMADLRQSLQQAGVSLAEVTVGQGSDQGEQAWKWESARPSGKQGFFPTASSDVEEQTGINRSSIRGNGSTLVDYLI